MSLLVGPIDAPGTLLFFSATTMQPVRLFKDNDLKEKLWFPEHLAEQYITALHDDSLFLCSQGLMVSCHLRLATIAA